MIALIGGTSSAMAPSLIRGWRFLLLLLLVTLNSLVPGQ